jgi:hypothetical protein
LLQQSEVFSNAIWTRLTSTVSANIATAPNGTLTADKLVESTTNNFQNIFQVVTQINSSYTYSVYLKKGQNDRCVLFAGSAQALLWIDMTNWTSFSQSNVNSYSINAVGNDWYRVVFTYTNTSSGSHQTGINLIQIGTSNTVTYAGNTSNGLFIWGAQLVEGTSALDYQMTETRLNIPRLDYSLGSCPNILLEPQRTNIFVRSEEFDNASWNKTNASITANTTISPSGIQNADTMTDNATVGIHGIDYAGAVGVYTCSVYAKKGTSNFIGIYSSSALQGVIFNLNTGTFSANIIAAPTSYSITSVGNGWYRCTITTTTTSTAVFRILMSNDGSGFNYSGTGQTVFLWGAQLEAGAYATSYIPTTSASVTRNLDVVQATGVSSLIGQTEGTLYWEGTMTSGLDDLFYLNRSATNSVVFYKNATNTIVFRIFYGGSSIIISTATAYTGTVKIAASYKSGDSVLYINGVQVGTSATAFTFTGALTDVVLNNSAFLFGNATKNIKTAALFPTRLTNAQLAALTA